MHYIHNKHIVCMHTARFLGGSLSMWPGVIGSDYLSDGTTMPQLDYG